MDRQLKRFANDLNDGAGETRLERSNRPLDLVIEAAEGCDLIILGVQRTSDRRKLFGPFILSIARRTTCPILVVCRR